MNPSIDPSPQNLTLPPSSTEATVPEPAQSIPPSPHPPTDIQNALAPTPTAPAPQPPLTVEKQANADAPQPALENQNGVTDRQLNVTDALSYLDAVKIQFHDRPDVYNVFLDIMKDFKSQDRYSRSNPTRCNPIPWSPFPHPGFQHFLPVGYRIEVGSDSQSSEVITVTTPSGTMLRSTNTPSISAPPPSLLAPPQQEISQLPPPDQPIVSTTPLPSTSALGLSNTPKLSGSSIDLPTTDDHERQVLGPAMEYVQRIETRFSNDPDTYEQLEILSHKSSNVRPAPSLARPCFGYFHWPTGHTTVRQWTSVVLPRQTPQGAPLLQIVV
ncbi:hypothetical protein EDB89DRAFT_609720 [Lactarius sanguifluus]|nr:hypothetical protein EDB89DRAFT_609720 [Lactarius sanguifluus]